MSNRILDVTLKTVRLDPTEAEVWITVTAEHLSPTTEIRGRFVGPKAPNHSTIEIAYPLRSFQKKPPSLPELAARGVIPEPTPWKPHAPFVYDVVVELWEEGELCDQRKVSGYALRKLDAPG